MYIIIDYNYNLRFQIIIDVSVFRALSVRGSIWRERGGGGEVRDMCVCVCVCVCVCRGERDSNGESF